MRVLDFGRSFVGVRGSGNCPRFQVESRTFVNGGWWLPCASCKGERTFAESQLFTIPSYDFLPVFGFGKVVAFRKYAYVGDGEYLTERSEEEMWGSVTERLAESEGELLSGFDSIASASEGADPIVARVSVPCSGFMVECPVKTLNVDGWLGKWQVDTGPVVVPFGSVLSLAYLAFNSSGFVDFIVKSVTGGRGARVMHYSVAHSYHSENELYALRG